MHNPTNKSSIRFYSILDYLTCLNPGLMMKYYSLCILLFVLFYAENGKAQNMNPGPIKKGPFSIYLNSPLGLINKVRIKAEYRYKENHAVLFCLTRYHGINAGLQSYLEYRKYLKGEIKPENFVYVKGGGGISTTYNGIYGLLGLGVGQKYNFGKAKSFSIQFTEGLKYCPALRGDVESETSSGLRGAFYLIGPGAVIDLNISLGWRF